MSRIRYACDECGAVYKSYEDASECCPPEPVEVTKRKCGHWVPLGMRKCTLCDFNLKQVVLD